MPERKPRQEKAVIKEEEILEDDFLKNKAYFLRKSHINEINTSPIQDDTVADKPSCIKRPRDQLLSERSLIRHDLKLKEPNPLKILHEISTSELQHLNKKFVQQEAHREAEEEEIAQRIIYDYRKPRQNKSSKLKEKSTLKLFQELEAQQRMEQMRENERKEIEKREQRLLAPTLSQIKAVQPGHFSDAIRRDNLKKKTQQWDEWVILKRQELCYRATMLSQIAAITDVPQEENSSEDGKLC